MRGIKISQSITDRSDESLAMFFKDIAKIPLLDIDEEIKLAERIKNGDTDAINKLIESNLRFVVSVAKQYQGKGLPLVDLIQEGCIGAREAASKWDPTRGFKFISYAVWWIRQAITLALSNNCRTVRVPNNHSFYYSKINKTIEKFEQLYNRKPTIEEISKETGLSKDKIIVSQSISNKALSLDSQFKDEESGTLLDVIPNTNIKNLDFDIIQSEISSELSEILNNLTDREYDIIRMSFGLGMEEMENEEIACRFGIGEERVRQIIKEVISKLKKNYSNELKKLL